MPGLQAAIRASIWCLAWDESPAIISQAPSLRGRPTAGASDPVSWIWQYAPVTPTTRLRSRRAEMRVRRVPDEMTVSLSGRVRSRMTGDRRIGPGAHAAESCAVAARFVLLIVSGRVSGTSSRSARCFLRRESPECEPICEKPPTPAETAVPSHPGEYHHSPPPDAPRAGNTSNHCNAKEGGCQSPVGYYYTCTS